MGFEGKTGEERLSQKKVKRMFWMVMLVLMAAEP